MKKDKKEYRFQIILALITIIIASIIIPVVFEWYHHYNEKKIVFNHLKFEIDRNLEIINNLKNSQEDMANSPLFTPIRFRYNYLERSLDFINNETIWADVSDTLYNIKTANSFMDVIRDLDTKDYAVYSIIKKQNINHLIDNLSKIKSGLMTIKYAIK